MKVFIEVNRKLSNLPKSKIEQVLFMKFSVGRDDVNSRHEDKNNRPPSTAKLMEAIIPFVHLSRFVSTQMEVAMHSIITWSDKTRANIGFMFHSKWKVEA